MNLALKVLLFLTSNIIGVWMGPILFFLFMVTEITNVQEHPGFMNWYLMSVMATWAVCAIFSISFFFLYGAWKYFFLIMPVVIPLIVGITLPFLY